jgi:hypothetical protein
VGQRARAWKRRRGTRGDPGSAVWRGKIPADLDRRLAGTSTDPDHARRAQQLHQHRESVLRFLAHDLGKSTNNLGEQQIRGGVRMRQWSAGDRTEAGAEAHAVQASRLQTYRRPGREILDERTALLHHGPGHVLESDPIAPPIPAQ